MGTLSEFESHHVLTISGSEGPIDAARRIQLLCADLGIEESVRDRAVLVVSELSTNLARHVRKGGEIFVRPTPSGGLEILAVDSGPGFDIRYRADSGLSRVRELSSHLDIHSDARGTIVLASIEPAPSERLARLGVVAVPHPSEAVSGDGYAHRKTEHGLQLLVADGLGHGVRANKASRTLVEFFEREPDLKNFVDQAHDVLHGTRGAVFLVAEVDFAHGQLLYSSVGNVLGRVYDPSGSRSLANRPGMLGGGSQRTTPVIERLPWTPQSRLILASDGLQSSWKVDSPTKLWDRDPRVIAASLIRDFSRRRDDATVAVLASE